MTIKEVLLFLFSIAIAIGVGFAFTATMLSLLTFPEGITIIFTLVVIQYFTFKKFWE